MESLDKEKNKNRMPVEEQVLLESNCLVFLKEQNMSVHQAVTKD